jgi:hypothetical protein
MERQFIINDGYIFVFLRHIVLSEQQRAQWVLSMPACSSINLVMQKVENLHYETSDQHKESTKSRQERDNKNLMTVVNFLNKRNPFIENSCIYYGHTQHTCQ